MDSDPPLIFKRSGKAKPLRTRQKSPTGEAETGTENNEGDSPSILSAKLKNKTKKPKFKSTLSFGAGDQEEEGDAEEFKLKKSRLSSKISLGKNAANVPLNLDQATISSNRGPPYDQAYLNQLKANTPSARPNLPNDGDAMLVDSEEVVRTVNVFEDDAPPEQTTEILSESAIKVAKEKRDRLRKVRDAGEEDFISLSLTRRSDDIGPHPSSRLVREEDELGEAEEEFADYTSAQDRIALGKKSRKVEASKRREAMKEMIEDVDDEDEETKEWESEQLRRGGHRTPEPPASKAKQIYKPAPIPAVAPLPTLPPVLNRLSEQLAQLTASHAKNTSALSSLALEREQVDDREKEMRDMVIRAGDKKAWFVDFQEWIESVASFLDEKYPSLEKIEDDHTSLLRERHAFVAQRRRQDDEDDLSSVYGTLPPAAEHPQGDPDADDLGRTIPKPSQPGLKRERRAERASRRNQRLLRTASRKPEADEEGYSTDSSLPPADASDYATAISSLKSRTKGILADVRAEEFKTPSSTRWNAWREKYEESYRNAWGGLGIVSVWELWVRLETATWDCIEDKRSLDSFKWYKGLYDYSRPATGGEVEEPELGPDGDLVAAMTSTAIIPRMCKALEGGALDVYSEKHIKRVVDLAEEVEASIEGSNSMKYQTLLGSVVSLFQAAIADTESLIAKFHSLRDSTQAFDPDAIPSRRRFLLRRVKLLKNLLRWRKFTGERFGLDRLIGRLIDNCFMTVAEGGWDVGGEEVARTVLSILPKGLTSPTLKARLQM
ncbi:nineteen complex-related protein 2-domain-containing protein [Coprinopsis sp. MPI-PUGE-AT-0042]|nr:nineteen complex-related protein 2-domain-containing protein [Coprinopsis sp. MPI-PUGE-AT-0042]